MISAMCNSYHVMQALTALKVREAMALAVRRRNDARMLCALARERDASYGRALRSAQLANDIEARNFNRRPLTSAASAPHHGLPVDKTTRKRINATEKQFRLLYAACKRWQRAERAQRQERC